MKNRDNNQEVRVVGEPLSLQQVTHDQERPRGGEGVSGELGAMEPRSS